MSKGTQECRLLLWGLGYKSQCFIICIVHWTLPVNRPAASTTFLYALSPSSALDAEPVVKSSSFAVNPCSGLLRMRFLLLSWILLVAVPCFSCTGQVTCQMLRRLCTLPRSPEEPLNCCMAGFMLFCLLSSFPVLLTLHRGQTCYILICRYWVVSIMIGEDKNALTEKLNPHVHMVYSTRAETSHLKYGIIEICSFNEWY